MLSKIQENYLIKMMESENCQKMTAHYIHYLLILDLLTNPSVINLLQHPIEEWDLFNIDKQGEK